MCKIFAKRIPTTYRGGEVDYIVIFVGNPFIWAVMPTTPPTTTTTKLRPKFLAYECSKMSFAQLKIESNVKNGRILPVEAIWCIFNSIWIQWKRPLAYPSMPLIASYHSHHIFIYGIVFKTDTRRSWGVEERERMLKINVALGVEHLLHYRFSRTLLLLLYLGFIFITSSKLRLKSFLQHCEMCQPMNGMKIPKWSHQTHGVTSGN